MIWYVLFDGTSTDGMGEGKFLKRTTDKSEAAKHYKKVQSPYSTGKVIIINDFDFRLATKNDFDKGDL